MTAVSRILSAVNGFKKALGIPFGNAEENSSRAVRFAPRLFPVSERGRTNIEERRKLRLRQTQSLPDFPHVRVIMPEGAFRLCAAL